MWAYFWAYQTDLPADAGFDPFSRPHLTWVIAALTAIMILTCVHHKLMPAARRRMEGLLAVVLALTYMLRWIWALVIGHYQLNEMLPLQLCAVAAALDIAAVFSGKPVFREFGYSCGLPGAVVVFLTPGIGPYPVLHFYYLLFIVDHSLLILFPLIWIINDRFRPSFRRLPACFGIVLVMAGLDVGVNRLIGSNYMFLNFVPDHTFWKPIADRFGYPGYQLAMAGLLLLVWLILYAPWIAAARRKTAKTLQ
ncbi:MAG: TIGR02206 family membrane protein [Clostridiaceae bacterium]|nr:TIGR02206 family membrane protein [Clostridiaceae bacterium]